jgi:hypothetical protein
MSMRPVPNELYRCFYVTSDDSGSFDPRRLAAWEVIRSNDRGRWDDPSDEFRVLYTAGTEATALIEVLAPLRPSKKTVDAVDTIEDPDDPSSLEDHHQQRREQARRAVDARLAPRFMALLRTPVGPQAYDVLHGASRTDIEEHLGLEPGSLKTGDFATRDIGFTQAVSRFVYDQTGAVGIYSTSAEDGNGYVTVFFEDGQSTGVLRIGEDLAYEESRRASTCTEALEDALAYLDIVPKAPDVTRPASREPVSHSEP